MRFGSLASSPRGRLVHRACLLSPARPGHDAPKPRSALRELVLSIGIALVSISPAFGQADWLEDHQIPWGPEGTIGRGSSGASRMGLDGNHYLSSMRNGGGYGPSSSGYSGYSAPTATYSRGYGYAPSGVAARAGSWPYLTNYYYEPGDGYRYPLYYNPAGGTYYYYPVRR